jgi:hypothetical protein
MSDNKKDAPAKRPLSHMLKLAGLAVLAVLAGILAFRVFLDAGDTEPPAKRQNEPILLTALQEKALPAWGNKMARLLSDGLGEDLSQMHDYEAIAEITLEGTDGEEVRRDLNRLIRSAVTRKAGGFLASATGYPARFLRVCTRAGFPAVTLRVHYGNQLVSYLDVLLQPADDNFKIVDVYDYLTGARRTENFRCTMAPFLIAKDSQIISKWLENWKMQKSDAEYIISLFKARLRGLDEDALTVCDQAPEHMRNNRLVFFTRCQALQHLTLSNARYERLYFEALQSPPSMPDTQHVLELLLIPKLMAEADYQTADDAMEKVMTVIGDDAYLMCRRAEIKFQLEDIAAAKALLKQAQRLEPTLPLLQELKQKRRFSNKNGC